MGNAAWVDQDFAETRARGRAETVRDEMTAGEKVVWEGHPQLGWMFLLSLPLAFVGFAAGIISLMWIASASSGNDLLALFGLPFLLASAAMVLSPVWFVWRGMGTAYVITNRRAIVCQPLLIPGVQVRSYPPSALQQIIRNQRGDGSGDLIFEEVRRTRGRDRRSVRRGFLAVADVRRVETLLRETLLHKQAGR